MSKNYGIRISQPGYDVKTCTDPQTIFSSKFDNLKIHSRGTGTIYDSTGRTHTIAHNLGYVPAFIIHSQGDTLYNTTYTPFSGKYLISPIETVASDVGSPYYWNNRSTSVWADSTNIYIKLYDDFGYKYSFPETSNDFGEDVGFYASGTCRVGYSSVWSHAYDKGAIRFHNIDTASSVYKATLGFYIAQADSNSTPIKVYGIDEDNTADFAGDPFGRPLTTAYETPTRDSGLTAGNTWAFGVTSPFNEVITRGGWSSGNHLGFILEDNRGSTANFNGIRTELNDSGNPWYTQLTYIKWLQNDLLTTYRYTIFKNKLV